MSYGETQVEICTCLKNWSKHRKNAIFQLFADLAIFDDKNDYGDDDEHDDEDQNVHNSDNF